MKKLFFFAAAMCAAMTINAATYSFAGIAADAISVDGNGAKSTCTMGSGADAKEYPSVNYTSTSAAEMTTTFAGISNFAFKYSNKDSKDNILKCHKDYLQVDGKNGILSISGLANGTQVTINVIAKGSTNAVFTVEGGTAATSNPESVSKTEAADLSFTASASTMTIKETAGGFRIMTITIGGGTGLMEATAAPAEVKKVIIDGKLFIRNAAGELVSVLGF